ncbi:hypothetical protein JCM8097_005828 [Rhodosporidiobolus ruineniae]
MLRFTLLSAVLAAATVRASVLSTSVFPNSACSGAGSALSGLVGVGQVKLANGDVELHCGCPSDNLDSFEVCPSSSTGIAVCNSVLNLETEAFTASCGTVTCSGADCPSTVTNVVVVPEEDCYNSEKGAIGIATVDGEASCACASDVAAADFKACPSPDNGRAVCRDVDADFLGAAAERQEKISCAVECDEGYFLSPGGSCVALAKRAVAGPSGAFHTAGPGKVGPSKVWYPASSTPIKVGPSHTTTSKHHHHTSSHHHHTSSHHHGHHTSRPDWQSPPTSAPTTSKHPHHAHTPSTPTSSTSHHHHHHHSSYPGTSRPSWQSHTPIKVGPSPTPSPTTFSRSRGPGKVGPSATFPGNEGPGKVGPSQRARRAAEEFVFTDVCAQDERTCAAGSFGDFSCVRLDDVTECGGCHSTGDAKNCLEIAGASSVACLRGGCVVRSCQTGFVQTSEGTCERKA